MGAVLTHVYNLLSLPPMDAYWMVIVLGFTRLALAGAVLYVLACLIFPLRSVAWATNIRAERQWARALLASAIATLLVVLLVLLGLYDGFVLLGSLVLIPALVLWRRRRRRAVSGRYVRLLELADHWPSIPSLLRTWIGRRGDHPLPIVALLIGLVLSGAALRLLPLLASPAPFSIMQYRLLERAQHLQAGWLFPGHLIEPHGLPGLSVALHTLGVVDLGIVVRLLGVGASLFLVVGIYVAVRGYSGDSAAALGAAGLFCFGLPILPFAVENQVEPTSMLLATAYALPTWYFLLRYQMDGEPSRWGVGGMGIGLLLLTESFVATLTLTLLGGTALLQGLRAFTPVHARRARHVLGLCIGGGGLLVGGRVLQHLLPVPDPYAVPVFSVEGAGVPFYPADWSLGAYGGIVGATVLMLLVAAHVDAQPFRRLVSKALAGSCLILYAVWVFVETVPVLDLSPTAPTALLSVFLCVAVGGLFARVITALQHSLRRPEPRAGFGLLYYRFVPGLLLTGALLAPLPILPTLEHAVEPAGYVRAIHDIQRTGQRYQWTAVSHYGTGVHAMNRGRFLAYDYFLQHYDAETYDHTGAEAIPTDDLFLFVPTDTALSLVREEMLPFADEIGRAMQRWCDTYRQRSKRLSLFYHDEHLNVYRITRPPQTPPPVSSLSSRSPALPR